MCLPDVGCQEHQASALRVDREVHARPAAGRLPGLEHGGDDAMKPFVTPLSTALGHLQQATGWLMQNALAKPDNAGAAATDYMQLFGLVAFAYMWARMAKVANDKIAASGATPYLKTKLVTDHPHLFESGGENRRFDHVQGAGHGDLALGARVR